MTSHKEELDGSPRHGQHSDTDIALVLESCLRILKKRSRADDRCPSTGAANGSLAIERAESVKSAAKNPPTLRALAEGRFRQYVDGSMRLQPKSKEYYRYGWLMISPSKIADMRIDQITSEDIDCLDVGGSPSNQNCARRTLRRMLRLAVSWALVDRVCKVVLLEECGRESTVDATVEQKIHDALPRGTLKIAWPIYLDTGMRPKEMAGLEVPDLDFANAIIVIRRKTTKTAAGKRMIPMSSRVREVLTEHLKGRTNGWVFPSARRPGMHISAASMTAAFAKARKVAGADPAVKLYSTRHTFGTEIMEETRDPFLVMKLLGHTELSTTKRYQHPKLDGVADFIDRRNKARSQKLPNRD